MAAWRHGGMTTAPCLVSRLQVQLAAAGDSSGGVLRWSQAGAVHTLPNVSMAVATDLSDPGRCVTHSCFSTDGMKMKLDAMIVLLSYFSTVQSPD